MTDKAGPTGVVSPEVLAAASSCPYIQRVVAEVGDPQLVSNSLGPFMTLASTTSLAEPLGAAGAGAAEEAAAAAAAANAAADADADEAAERAARRDMGSPQPPETPRDRLSHSGGPAAAGKCSLLTTTIATRTPTYPAQHTEPSSCDVCHVDPAEGLFLLISEEPLFAHEQDGRSHLSEACLDEEEVWLLVLLATP